MKSISFFFRPAPLLTVLIMALNDHYFKYAYPGFITGKLSDFAGMFYFPIFLAALVVLAAQGLGKKNFRLNRSVIIGSIVFADFLLLLVKLTPQTATAIEHFFYRFLFQIDLVSDPTDLMALLMSFPAYLYLRKYQSYPES